MMIIRIFFVVFFGNVDLPDYPSISPDGSSVLFSWRGDLWLCSAKGGRAVRITSHPGEETRSAWNRQGDLIAFESNRNGARKIYVMNLDGTGIRLVTDIDVTCTLAGFGVDEGGQPVLTFDSSLNGDNYRSPRPYQISLQGGELTLIHKAFGSEPRLSPDGKFCLFTRGGIGWMRRFYHGPDQNDVWLYSRADDEFRQLTNWHGKDGKACWAGNETMYFLSDRNDDRVNVYKQSLSSRKAEQVTFFVDNDIKEFDVSADGRSAVLAVWDQLYTLDLTAKNAQPVALDITANEDETDSVILTSIEA